MSSRQEQIREREREREHEQKQRSLQNAFNQDGGLDRNFIDELLKSDDLTTGEADDLQEVTVAKIQNMLSRDWVLANLTSAQEHDIRYKLEVIKHKVYGMHPPQESAITGKTRAFLYDDAMEELQPLSPQERVLIDDLFESLKGRITRGRDGFERKQMNTNIAETKTHRGDDDSGGGLSGLFS